MKLLDKKFFLHLCLIVILGIYTLPAKAMKIELPIDCTLGENCWITNLPRHFYNGREVDYKCSTRTYAGHKGTDFILEDMEQMKQGVDVLSPFDGIVKAVRNDMEDVSVEVKGLDKVKDKECGNGVVVTSAEYEAQLCHLQKGSIYVKVGDQVTAGQRIGSVGLSGNTDHPRLTFNLYKKQKDGKFGEIDPFYGDQEKCGLKPSPLWMNPEYLMNNVKEGTVYNYGVAFEVPRADKVINGYYKRIIQPHDPEIIMVYADILFADKNHKIKIEFLDSENKILFEKQEEITKPMPKYFTYIGKNLHHKQIKGNFIIKITYTKPDGGGGGDSIATYSKEVIID